MGRKGVDLVPVGYFILDETGRIEEANEIAGSLVGASSRELGGRRLVDFIVPSDTWRFLRHLHVASTSARRESCRVEFKGEDGSTLTHLFTCAERSDDGTTVRFHTAVQTVAAELIRAKEEAEQMSRLKTAFLANMSHEIRTPLTGILGFASVLAKELPEEQREFAELIRSSGRRLLEVLSSVLDLAKLESNQMKLESREVDLAGEIQKVVGLLAPIAQEKGLVLETERPESGPILIQTDRAALSRVLHNLIGNAIKFTNEGRVRVRVWSSDDRAGFDVIDTGIGIDPKFIPQLFDEFSQESSGTSRSHSGAGLGLAITKQLLDLMGGRIEVESEQRGGSRFAVSLPHRMQVGAGAAAPADEHVHRVERRRRAAGAARRLLLVEDDADTQHLLVELLEKRYEVSTAGGATDAFLLASRNHFDLILLDIELGEGPDGIELLRQLRAVSGYAETPIVALTAHALPGDRERFLSLGFSAYVSKPFDVDELLDLPARFR